MAEIKIFLYNCLLFLLIEYIVYSYSEQNTGKKAFI